MGLLDGAVNGMVMRLCEVAFSPDEAFCIAQAAYIARDKRDPRVPPSILNRQEVTAEVDLTLKRLGPYPMGPDAHRRRILLWEKIFGFGTWHEPIDPDTVYLPGVPKPPLPPIPPKINPQSSLTGAVGLPHAQGAAPLSIQPASRMRDLSRPLYGATLTEAYWRFWRKYATTSGRASRSEYWWATLANLLIVVVLGLAGTASGREGGYFFGVLYLVFFVVVILPSFAITVRRLHDAGLSGWFYLPTLIPVLGVLMLAQPSDPKGARFDRPAAGTVAPQSHPRDTSDPVLTHDDRAVRSAVSPTHAPVTSQNGSHSVDHEGASDGTRGAMIAITVIAMIALVALGVVWIVIPTQKPQTAAASPSAVDDGQAASIRARLQGTPDWHQYKGDVFLRWDPNPQCIGTLSCNGIDVETASTVACSYGSVWLDLLRNGVVVDTRLGTFQSLSAGIPKLVQVYWNPNVTGDQVHVNKVSCGS